MVLRWLCVFALVLVCFFAAPQAQSRIYCGRIESLPDANSSARVEIGRHVAPTYGLEPSNVKTLSSRYFLVVPGRDIDCSSGRCHYRVFVRDEGRVEEVVSFRGSGFYAIFATPVATPVEFFKDEYSSIHFEMPDRGYLAVGFPRTGRFIVAEALSEAGVKWMPRGCKSG